MARFTLQRFAKKTAPFLRLIRAPAPHSLQTWTNRLGSLATRSGFSRSIAEGFGESTATVRQRSSCPPAHFDRTLVRLRLIRKAVRFTRVPPATNTPSIASTPREG